MQIPYGLGMLMAHYVHQRCQLCGVSFSTANSTGNFKAKATANSTSHACNSTSNKGATSSNTLDHPSSSKTSQQQLAQRSLVKREPKLVKKELKRISTLFKKLDTGILCDGCQQSIDWLPEPFELMTDTNFLQVQSATNYQYPVDELIRKFKLYEDMNQLPILVYLLQQLPRPRGCHAGNSVILPMPTTKQRLQKRGFDPISLLAPYLAQYWQIPLWHGVKRVGDSVSQRGLSRAERLQNLTQAFDLVEQVPVSHVILFDDVVTTGATMTALANELESASSRVNLRGYCLAHVEEGMLSSFSTK